jgi:hypothetical protein
MLPETATEEMAATLDRLVADVLGERGIGGPPVDALAVAARLGITVARDDGQPGRARYVLHGGRRRSRSGATILLRCEPRPERRQWAVAHELGEHLAAEAFVRLGLDPCEASPRGREAVANQLAARLLLPSAWFEAEGPACGWNLLELKARFPTASHELIARRMLECRPPVIITIFDRGRRTLRRSNVPGRVPPLSPAEQACWQAVHQDGRPEKAWQGTLLVEGWPVHEPDWRREILRAEVDPWALEAGD